MSAEPPPFLRRWSQRKLEAGREAQAKVDPPATPVARPPEAVVQADAASAPASDAIEPALPPVDSLTFDSDFAAFLKPGVDQGLRQQALRKLFADPRFNVMDGLDVYIDDYGKFVPIPPELVAQLQHAKFLFSPPPTFVNAQGHVEDVPANDSGEEQSVTPTVALEEQAPTTQVEINTTDAKTPESPGSR